jgi:AcrR family transcriptional regulator
VSTQEALEARPRSPLSRERIVRAALDYIDANGLDALSMHKLGAELGVKAMSLYNHVANKDDVLDGVVELMWTEVETDAPVKDDWRAGTRALANAMRDMVRRHPNAATLTTTQSYMPQSALRTVQRHVAALTTAGLREDLAYALLRTVTSYALGSAYSEVAWSTGQPGCAPAVSDLLRPGTPEDLIPVANDFCGRYDYDNEFRLGLDLMLRGVEQQACPDAAKSAT